MKVLKSFKTNSEPDVKVRRGCCGVVESIDKEGDAQISFAGQDREEWVFQHNFRNLSKIKRMPPQAQIYTVLVLRVLLIDHIGGSRSVKCASACTKHRHTETSVLKHTYIFRCRICLLEERMLSLCFAFRI